MNVLGFPLRRSNKDISQKASAIVSTSTGSSGQTGTHFTPELMMNMCAMFAQMSGNPNAASAGLANLQINKRRKSLPAPNETAGGQASGSEATNVAETPQETPQDVEAVEPTAKKANKGFLALEDSALDLPVFDGKPETSEASKENNTKKQQQVPTDVLSALVARDDSKKAAKEQGKAKGTAAKQTPKPKAGSKAKAKAKAKAKGQGKANASSKSSPKSGSVLPMAKSHVKKPATRVQGKNGWVIETRVRPDGQKDKHYLSPDGKSFRTQGEAKAAGWKE